tara:strand:+ start:948 stop:1202 length:255 start_codon:yes stop_codon:yes gene_type:complete
MNCPICDKVITGHPALSRVDNETEICDDCSVRQALEAFNDSQIPQEYTLEDGTVFMARDKVDADRYIQMVRDIEAGRRKVDIKK